MRGALLAGTLVTLALASLPAKAEGVELIPYWGYRLGGEFDDFGSVDQTELDEGSSWGVAVDIPFPRRTALELAFSRQDTELQAVDGLFGTPVTLFELRVDHYHVGGLYHFAGRRSRVRPFVGASLGVTRFDPKSAAEEETRFSAGLSGGAKFFFGPHVGVRIQGRIVPTFVDSENRVFCDGFDCYDSEDTSYVTQFEPSAGLILRF